MRFMLLLKANQDTEAGVNMRSLPEPQEWLRWWTIFTA